MVARYFTYNELGPDGKNIAGPTLFVLRRSVLGSWVGARNLFHLSLYIISSRMALPQDPSTEGHRRPHVVRPAPVCMASQFIASVEIPPPYGCGYPGYLRPSSLIQMGTQNSTPQTPQMGYLLTEVTICHRIRPHTHWLWQYSAVLVTFRLLVSTTHDGTAILALALSLRGAGGAAAGCA